MSIRARLLLFFSGFALLAIGLSAGFGVFVVRDRAHAYAVQSFVAAREQLGLSLRHRLSAFEATSELARTLEVVRQVTNYKDKADWGFASPAEDEARRRELHDDLADAPWGWARASRDGFTALTDYKGRVVYTSTGRDVFGASTSGLGPVAEAYDPGRNFRSAGIIRGDDPALAAAGLLPVRAAECYVLYAQGIAPQGVAGAALVVGIPAEELLREVALVDEGTSLALLGPAGLCAGRLPDAVQQAGLALADDTPPVAVRSDGTRWLVQRFALPSPHGSNTIGTMLVGQDLDTSLALLDQATVLLIVAVVPLFGVAFVVASFLAGWLARPVIELEGAARRVAAGDLDVTVAVGSTDEIGRLAEAFNRMTDGLRDRERIKQAFQKYMAPQVVEYLLTHPGAQALGGKRQRLTVMFSDLEGFTAMSERLEPEEVVALLNEYFSEVSRRIAGRGGTIDKYLGDAVMAFFGAPLPREDHAASACLAALDHLDVLDLLRERWQSREVLAVRIGVNTGDMIVGNVGGDHGQDYTVIGDAVNLASRLEGVNKVYGTRILVTEAVVEAAGGAVETREVDSVRVKGKAKAVRIFEVQGPAGGLSEIRLALNTRYAEGLGLYRAARFEDATVAFTAALALVPDDGPSAVLLARTQAHAHTPPAADWDGVFELTTK